MSRPNADMEGGNAGPANGEVGTNEGWPVLPLSFFRHACIRPANGGLLT